MILKVPEGFDDALVGIVTLPSDGSSALVYDLGKCIEILQARDEMTYGEAQEYLEFNAINAWVGVGTPLFIERCTPEWVRARKRDE